MLYFGGDHTVVITNSFCVVLRRVVCFCVVFWRKLHCCDYEFFLCCLEKGCLFLCCILEEITQLPLGILSVLGCLICFCVVFGKRLHSCDYEFFLCCVLLYYVVLCCVLEGDSFVVSAL